jgi:hypothetical protein
MTDILPDEFVEKAEAHFKGNADKADVIACLPEDSEGEALALAYVRRRIDDFEFYEHEQTLRAEDLLDCIKEECEEREREARTSAA